MKSSAAAAIRIYAWVVWVLGLIASILLSITIIPSRYGGNEVSFSFLSFILYAVVFGLAGGLIYVMAEPFEDLREVRNILSEIQSDLKNKPVSAEKTAMQKVEEAYAMKKAEEEYLAKKAEEEAQKKAKEEERRRRIDEKAPLLDKLEIMDTVKEIYDYLVSLGDARFARLLGDLDYYVTLERKYGGAVEVGYKRIVLEKVRTFLVEK